MFAALMILQDSGRLAAFASDERESLVLMFLDLHQYGYLLALMFFGLHGMVLGHLIVRANKMPRSLGLLMALAGLGYVVDGLMFFLRSQYDGSASALVLLPAFVAEIGLCLWLLRAGFTSRWTTPLHVNEALTSGTTIPRGWRP